MRKINLFQYYPAVFSAILLIGAFPRFNQSYLAWFSLLPIIIFSVKAPPLTAFKGGIVFGAVFHLYINYYLIVAMEQFLSLILAIIVYLLIALYLSLFYGLVFYLLSIISSKYSPFKVIFAFSFIWVLMEFVRSLGFLGYTAGFIGFSQWNGGFLLNIVSFYGYWGLAFVMAGIQILFAFIILKKISAEHIKRVTIILSIFIISGLFMPEIFPVLYEDETKNIALIQGNISREDILTGSEENLKTYIKLTKKAATSDEYIHMAVWPETVVSARIGRGNPVPPEIKTLSEELQIPLLYGAIVIEGDDRYNSVVFLNPHTKETDLYYKKILVPVVEYLPAGELLNDLLDLRVNLGHLTPGEAISVFNFEDIPISGAICFESFFGSYTRRFASKGAKHLFILTNDGWLRESIGLDQHAQIVCIRAAEAGIGVTQLANTGISIAADYRGREIMRSGIKRRETLYLKTDFTTRKTLYQLAGDYFIYLGLLIFLLSFIPLKSPLLKQGGFRRLLNR